MGQLPRAVIFDMDGTLCDVTSVRHYVLNKAKDYDHFHKGSIWCPPHYDVVNEVHRRKAEGDVILIVTARMERHYYGTRGWLRAHDIPYDAMHMRRNGDHRKDYHVKADILAQLQLGYTIVAAYDDNPNVINLWREAGIPEVIEVPGWSEEEAVT